MENEVKTKKKKSIFKKWWFWVIIAVVVIGIISSTSSEPSTQSTPNNNIETSNNDSSANKNNETSKKEYQKVDLQTIMDELTENALRAESKYQNAYIEFTGKIANFDSDGSYITVEPTNADEWNFDTIMCYIKSDDQKNFIIEKSVGDQVTIKGKVFSIGEVLGYSLNIDSIS
jgi:uncharacterized protein YpmS